MAGWIAFLQVLGQKTDLLSMAFTLSALCFFIIKEKFINKLAASIAFFIASAVLAQYWCPYILFASLPMLDFAFWRIVYLYVPSLCIAVYIAAAGSQYPLLLPLIIAGFVGYLLGTMDRNEKADTKLLDDERRLRYSLEHAQNELIKSRREIESLTQARERNRIAQQLHDSIGHGIAGVLMQLQAALLLHRKDADKTEELLKTCVQKLTETLTLTRDTVYNMRTDVKSGIGAIEGILNGFHFCPVEFEHSGDFLTVSSANMHILEANLTEALTNASRHSKATRIAVKIDIRRNNIRFFYKDNGIGCRNIHESLGLSGMRERVRNANGTISVDGNDGFMIVCNLPEDMREEDAS